MLDARARFVSERLASAAKELLREKLDGVVLYGSYARGDFDKESDVDILVRINCDKTQLSYFRDLFCPTASRLSLDYGVTVSVAVADRDSFNRYKTVLPFYRNIEREGIAIA